MINRFKLKYKIQIQNTVKYHSRTLGISLRAVCTMQRDSITYITRVSKFRIWGLRGMYSRALHLLTCELYIQCTCTFSGVGRRDREQSLQRSDYKALQYDVCRYEFGIYFFCGGLK